MAVICALHPRRGHLLQHLLLPEAALLPGPGTERWRGCSSWSGCQSCGWCLHAAIHSHQNTFWGAWPFLFTLRDLCWPECDLWTLKRSWSCCSCMIAFSHWLNCRQWLICLNHLILNLFPYFYFVMRKIDHKHMTHVWNRWQQIYMHWSSKSFLWTQDKTLLFEELWAHQYVEGVWVQAFLISSCFCSKK